MPITLDRRESGCLVRLDGIIDISLASELKEALLHALESGREVQIELDEVTELDVTALQVLWAADQSARESGTRLTIYKQIPENVLETMKLAGLQDFLTSKQ